MCDCVAGRESEPNVCTVAAIALSWHNGAQGSAHASPGWSGLHGLAMRGGSCSGATTHPPPHAQPAVLPPACHAAVRL